MKNNRKGIKKTGTPALALQFYGAQACGETG
jgi:hypothetical protein